VNNGKSYAVGQSETTAKSSKEEKTTVNVNANKAAALRAQLGAKGKK
jgi:DNA uptake protein ComE-like DNA-binding protein